MTLLNLHIASIFFAGGVLLLADKQAFAWMRGNKRTLSPLYMRLLHYGMWAALLCLITTGTLLFLPRYAHLLSQPLFVMKLLFVGVLVANAFLIGNLMHVALRKPFAEISAGEKLSLFASGAISTVSWISAVSLGLYLFY